MEISSRLEGLLAKACALNRSNKVKVYGVGRRLYLLNFDRTLMIQFCWDGGERFQPSVGFGLSDYGGCDLEVDGELIRFRIEKGGWVRDKWVRSDSMSPEEIEGIFQSLRDKCRSGINFSLNRDFLGLLDDGLSHVEFRVIRGNLEAVQRDIYSGSMIVLRRKEDGFFPSSVGEVDSVGVRTEDLKALFLFGDCFDVEVGEGALFFKGGRIKGIELNGLVARCFYDEMKGEVYGRQESQVRCHKQGVDRSVNEGDRWQA